MDHEDRQRATSNKAKVLALLQERGVVTNEQIRAVGGTRGMGRVNELQHELGREVIQVRKLQGGVWEIRYQRPALARSAETPVSYPDADAGPLFRRPEELGAYRS